jgi:hypothetical protein
MEGFWAILWAENLTYWQTFCMPYQFIFFAHQFNQKKFQWAQSDHVICQLEFFPFRLQIPTLSWFVSSMMKLIRTWQRAAMLGADHSHRIVPKWPGYIPALKLDHDDNVISNKLDWKSLRHQPNGQSCTRDFYQGHLVKSPRMWFVEVPQ